MIIILDKTEIRNRFCDNIEDISFFVVTEHLTGNLVSNTQIIILTDRNEGKLKVIRHIINHNLIGKVFPIDQLEYVTEDGIIPNQTIDIWV